MFTNDFTSCDHNEISNVIEQEEIQQFEVDLKSKSLNKVYDDINLTEPIMIVCSICKLELKYEDILIEEFIAEPLLDKEKIDVLSYIANRKVDETDADDCIHEVVSLELYQLVQLKLQKNNDPAYKIIESNFGEKEIYLTCENCSSILYEYFDAELENLNQGEETDDESDSDIFMLNEDDFTDDDDNDDNDDEESNKDDE